MRLKYELSYFASSFVNEFCSKFCPFKWDEQHRADDLMKIPLLIKACVLAVSGMLHNFTRLLLFFLQKHSTYERNALKGLSTELF